MNGGLAKAVEIERIPLTAWLFFVVGIQHAERRAREVFAAAAKLDRLFGITAFRRGNVFTFDINDWNSFAAAYAPEVAGLASFKNAELHRTDPAGLRVWG